MSSILFNCLRTTGRGLTSRVPLIGNSRGVYQARAGSQRCFISTRTKTLSSFNFARTPRGFYQTQTVSQRCFYSTRTKTSASSTQIRASKNSHQQTGFETAVKTVFIGTGVLIGGFLIGKNLLEPPSWKQFIDYDIKLGGAIHNGNRDEIRKHTQTLIHMGLEDFDKYAFMAANRGQWDVVRYFINCDRVGQREMAFLAASAEQVELVKYLVESGKVSASATRHSPAYSPISGNSDDVPVPEHSDTLLSSVVCGKPGGESNRKEVWDLVDDLLKQGAHFDAKESYAGITKQKPCTTAEKCFRSFLYAHKYKDLHLLITKYRGIGLTDKAIHTLEREIKWHHEKDLSSFAQELEPILEELKFALSSSGYAK